MDLPYGAMTAIITPFKNQKIDVNSYQKLIKRQIENGIDVIVPVGTTGESATLSHNEHKECIEIAIDSCKGEEIKVLAGAGSNSTMEAIELAKYAEYIGADGILVVTPYYNKPTQEGLYQHYKKIANSVEIPTLLYNVPSRTGVDMSADTVIRLANECKNIYGVKEATGSIERVIELLSKKSDLFVVSGDDAINYPILTCGGKGVISVTSNLLPDKVSKLVHSALEGDFETSKSLSEELYLLNKTLFCESNPIPIKAAMYIAGLIDTLEYRLPLTPPTKENYKLIERVISKYL